MPHKHSLAIISGSVFLFACDQILKYLARTNPMATHYIIKPWLGWEYLANPGVAFGIPVSNALLIIITPLILFLLILWLGKKPQTPGIMIGVYLVIFGAISNFSDRMLFGFTVDYFRIVTSVMNMADIMILVGVLLIFIPKNTPLS